MKLLSQNIVFLQESKLESFDNCFAASVWEARFKDWGILPFCGAFGGLLSCGTQGSRGQFSMSILFSVRGRGKWWFSSVYDPLRPCHHQDFFMRIGIFVGWFLLVGFWVGILM